MTKKEYVLKLLTTLEGKRPLAAGLKLLVEANVLDDQLIDSLQVTFAHAVHEVVNEDAKQALQSSHDFLSKLKVAELDSQSMDRHDLEMLDDMLTHM